jgi:hypothetical protein
MDPTEKVFSIIMWIALILMFLIGLATITTPFGLGLFSVSAAFFVCGFFVLLGEGGKKK